MVRLALTALAFSLVAGQMCNLQTDCSGCVATAGCVWTAGACWAASLYPFCSSDAACYQLGSICPVSASLYSSTAALYPAATVVPATTYVSAPLYTSTALPAVTTYASAPVYASATTTYAYPSYYDNGYYNRYNGYWGNNGWNDGYWGNGYNNWWGNRWGNNLFDFRGGVVDNTIRNNFYANALGPAIPGLGGAVSFANNYNLLANSPRFFDNVVGGYGYQRAPFNTYVRNAYYANALGGFLPGVSGALGTLNTYNLYSSLLG